jgi:hypothetical protein
MHALRYSVLMLGFANFVSARQVQVSASASRDTAPPKALEARPYVRETTKLQTASDRC